MTSTVLGPTLIVVCAVMALAAAGVYLLAGFRPAWAVPAAAARAAVQLAVVSTILAVAMRHLWSSAVVLVGMFGVAVLTAARRSRAERGRLWLTVSLGAGVLAVVPLLLLTGLVPVDGVAVIPVVAIVLGGTMTAVSVAARNGFEALALRAGEVEAALSLGFSDRDARIEILRPVVADALLPNVDQARTAGLVTLPGAFVGVLLSTGSATQAGAVQVMVLVGLLLSQSCGTAVTAELIARGILWRVPRVSR